VKLAGKHVAWSPDGKRALASAEDEETLLKKLDEAGIAANSVVISYEPPLGTVIL
jgi:hypothetical protein